VGSRGWWVEGEFPQQFAGVFGDDAEVEFADEHQELCAGLGAADADVVESAVVPEGELTVGVDAGFADAEVLTDVDAAPGGDRAGQGRPSVGGGAAGRRRGAAGRCCTRR
jgi:hypothetical protein